MRRLAAVVLLLVAAACRTAPSAPAVPSFEEPEDLRARVDATGFAATVLIHDLRSGRQVAVHGERAEEGRPPASTFKVVNALAALELGVVADERTVLPWDGVERPSQPVWNRDLPLVTAFRVSAVPHFQGIARAIGEERMQAFVDRLGYGNRDIGGGIDRFWLDGALRVSPRQQLELLERLQRNALPASVRSQETVKDLMLVEETPEYRIRAKTGWAMRHEVQVGWWIGWVERGDDVTFFVTALEATAPDPAVFLPARLEVTRAVLEALGYLPADAGPGPRAAAP